MGTGSTRKRSIQRSRYENYRAGNFTPSAAPTSGPLTTSQLDARYAGGGTGTFELDPQGNWRPVADPRISLGGGGMFGPAGQGRIANPKPNPEPRLPTDVGIEAGRREALLGALHGRQGPGAGAGSGRLGLEAQFNQLYGDPTADIRKAYADQEAAINKQYDAMLGRLGNEHGAAERGVRAEGAQLQTALTAIGADATAALSQSNRQIDQDYAKALKGVNADYKPGARDLAAQGAGGAGLKAEAAAGRADLREAHVADSALGQRYQQMLSQEINNRQATGATVTTANVQDLARILQQARDTTSTDRLAAVAKVEANMAGDLAQANNAKRQAKYSFFLDVLKSGGSLGKAGLKVATPGTINSAIRTLKSGNIDYSASFGGLSKSKNPDEIALGQKYEESLLNKTRTAQQIWAEWQANPNRADMPLLGDAIMQLVGYAQALQVSPTALKKYLRERGLK